MFYEDVLLKENLPNAAKDHFLCYSAVIRFFSASVNVGPHDLRGYLQIQQTAINIRHNTDALKLNRDLN
jgi:hypothetical protein